jgi:hypothetical protein
VVRKRKGNDSGNRMGWGRGLKLKYSSKANQQGRVSVKGI